MTVPRDLMAPDTEPTDEELHAVMVAARDEAVRLRAVSDAWIADRLAEGAARLAKDKAERKAPPR